jgi:hypothetical protein
VKYSNDELVAILNQEIAQSTGGTTGNGVLQQNRQTAADYYLGSLPASSGIAGRSGVVSTDVRDAIQAVMAQMMPLFAGEYPCEFEPERAGDERQAELETQAVARMLDNNQAYWSMYSAIHDALLMKNGIIKVWCEDYEYSTTAKFRGGDAADNAALLAAAGEGAEIESEQEGSVTLRTRETRPRLKVVSVAPERMYIDAGLRSARLSDARFVAEYKPITRSDLIEAGYSKTTVMNLPGTTNSGWDAALNLREMATANTWSAAATPDQELVDVYECYLKIAMKGDTSTLWRFIMGAETEILDKEQVEYLPYASGCIMAIPHRYAGISLFDLTKECQDIGTAVTRQWIDNNQAAVLNRLVIGPQVNQVDLENAGPNAHVRTVRGDNVQAAVMPLPFNDVGGSCEQLLAYKDRMRSQRSGASLDLQAAESQLMTAQVGAMGADRIMSSQEQVAGLYTRNISETLVRDTFLLVHNCLRFDYEAPIVLKQGEKWVSVDPGTWLERSEIAVRTGLTPGERNRKVGALTNQLTVATSAMQNGLNGILVDSMGIYRLIMDLARAQELESAAQYWIDPASERSQQAAQAMQQQQQQMQQQQAQIATLKDQVQAQKNQADAVNSAAELRFKYAELALNAEIEEAKLTGQVTLELQRLESEAESRSSAGTENTQRAAA